MIAHLKGKLLTKSTESAVVDAGGVGYELFIPLSTFLCLPEPGETVSIHVHTHLKEDAIRLYGFTTLLEKEVFCLLIGVTGVGPRLARNILSGVAVPDLVASIAEGDKARLSAIPGIGGKSAERLIVELKDKVASLAVTTAAAPARAADSIAKDVVSALGNLGYKPAQAEEAVKKARELAEEAHKGFEALLKESLRFLSNR